LIFDRRVQVLARHVAELIPSGAHSVLDVGCGDGSLARLAMSRRPELKVQGLETIARPVTAIPVREYDGSTLPYLDRSVDVVMLMDVLHHSDDAPRLLREASRVARRAVIIKDHLSDPWLGRRRLAAMDWVGNVGHGVPLREAYLDRAQWTAAFTEARLDAEECREDLGLYPRPARWLLENGLHFMCRLQPASAA
jgi:SAM-dependent methyltransferase